MSQFLFWTGRRLYWNKCAILRLRQCNCPRLDHRGRRFAHPRQFRRLRVRTAWCFFDVFVFFPFLRASLRRPPSTAIGD